MSRYLKTPDGDIILKSAVVSVYWSINDDDEYEVIVKYQVGGAADNLTYPCVGSVAALDLIRTLWSQLEQS